MIERLADGAVVLIVGETERPLTDREIAWLHHATRPRIACVEGWSTVYGGDAGPRSRIEHSSPVVCSPDSGDFLRWR